jgi:hypothetical protein
MHRTNCGKLIEINKMDFKNDQCCFHKIHSLKQTELLALLQSNPSSSFVKQIAPKSVAQPFLFTDNNINNN